MRFIALFALSLGILGTNVSTARAADCDLDFTICMASCVSLNPIIVAICTYNCNSDRTQCKKNPNNAYYGY
jgi:hypothetical protein